MEKDLVEALVIIRDAWFGNDIDRPAGGRYAPLRRAFRVLDEELRDAGNRHVASNDPMNAPKGNSRV